MSQLQAGVWWGSHTVWLLQLLLRTHVLVHALLLLVQSVLRLLAMSKISADSLCPSVYQQNDMAESRMRPDHSTEANESSSKSGLGDPLLLPQSPVIMTAQSCWKTAFKAACAVMRPGYH